MISYFFGFNSGMIFYRGRRRMFASLGDRRVLLRQRGTIRTRRPRPERCIRVRHFRSDPLRSWPVISFRSAIEVLNRRGASLARSPLSNETTFDVEIASGFHASIIVDLTGVFSCNDERTYSDELQSNNEPSSAFVVLKIRKIHRVIS